MMMSIHPIDSPGVSPNTPTSNTPYYKTYPFLAGSTGVLAGAVTGGFRAIHAPDLFINTQKKTSDTSDYVDIAYRLHYADAQRDKPIKGIYTEDLVKGHVNDYGELSKQKYVARGSGEYTFDEAKGTFRIVAPVQTLRADGSLQDVQPQVLMAQKGSQPGEFRLNRLQTFCPGHALEYWQETGVLRKGTYTPEHITYVASSHDEATREVKVNVRDVKHPLPVSEKDLTHFFTQPVDFLQNELPRTLQKQDRGTWKAVMGWGAGLGLLGFAMGWGADLLSRHHRKRRATQATHHTR